MRRGNDMRFQGRKERLNQLISGRANYFKSAKMEILLKRLDVWPRRLPLMVTWKRWKRIRTRFENLKKVGIDAGKAWE